MRYVSVSHDRKSILIPPQSVPLCWAEDPRNTARIDQVLVVDLADLLFVGVPADEDVQVVLAQERVEALLVAPGNDLVTVDHSDTEFTQLEDTLFGVRALKGLIGNISE